MLTSRLGPERGHQRADPGRARPWRWWPADWIVDALGLPAGSAVGFVTGGMMANYTCLSAARHAVLARAGWDVASAGSSTPRGCASSSAATATTPIDRAVRYLGLGQDSIVEVDTDDEGRIAVFGCEPARGR